jgi:hypothetical protein
MPSPFGFGCGIAVGVASPRITWERIASMSIAWYIAWRTRRSLKGFLPFHVEKSSSSRAWSSVNVITAVSSPSQTLKAAVLLQARDVLHRRIEHEVHLARAQRRHARGVAEMGRYSSTSMLLSERFSLRPHQSAFFSCTVFTPGS